MTINTSTSEYINKNCRKISNYHSKMRARGIVKTEDGSKDEAVGSGYSQVVIYLRTL